MERPLLIIKTRKKKLTQWLSLNHIGNPVDSTDAREGNDNVGSAGKPTNVYCNHAATIGTKMIIIKTISI